jgi:hypothetical protein
VSRHRARATTTPSPPDWGGEGRGEVGKLLALRTSPTAPCRSFRASMNVLTQPAVHSPPHPNPLRPTGAEREFHRRVARVVMFGGMALSLSSGACFGQSPSGVAPEPPAPMPPASTLPSFRSQGLGPEAPAAIPPASNLPTYRGRTDVGPEAPAAVPPTGTLPRFRQSGSTDSVPATPGTQADIVVPNGNGTSTIIHPDGTVQTVPTPR